jgi:membrane protein YdbS with pleckstrin-like domain
VTDAAFTTPSDNWQPVARKPLTLARRITLLLGVVPAAAILAVAWWLTGAPMWLAWIVGVGAILATGWAWWLIGRRVRSFAYTERADDLLVTSGILFRRLVIVPYGRMQLVDVEAGPIDRWLNISTVQLHTAAATTDAKIPGLEPQVAAELRDRLARIGEQRSAGL